MLWTVSAVVCLSAVVYFGLSAIWTAWYFRQISQDGMFERVRDDLRRSPIAASRRHSDSRWLNFTLKVIVSIALFLFVALTAIPIREMLVFRDVLRR